MSGATPSPKRVIGVRVEGKEGETSQRQQRRQRGGGGIANPSDLAAKYDVEYDSPSDEEPDQPPVEPQASAQPAGDFDWSQVEQVQREYHEGAAEGDALEESRREVERLYMLLEAAAPIPGVDLNKLSRGQDDEMDYRDAKIMQLAKKCRAVGLQHQKERNRADKLQLQVGSLQKDIATLKRQLGQARQSGDDQQDRDYEGGDYEGGADNYGGAQQETAADRGRDWVERSELLRTQQVLDDVRRRNERLTEDLRRTQRALRREVGEVPGEDSSQLMEKVMEDGWRGRAQQIVMLKSKIRQLEAGGAQTGPRRRRNDVDDRAQAELEHMEEERKRNAEELSQEFQQMQEEHEIMQQKVQARGARIRAMETEQQRMKSHMKTLVDKGRTDNELIEGLRDEVAYLREELRDAQEGQHR